MVHIGVNFSPFLSKFLHALVNCRLMAFQVYMRECKNVYQDYMCKVGKKSKCPRQIQQTIISYNDRAKISRSIKFKLFFRLEISTIIKPLVILKIVLFFDLTSLQCWTILLSVYDYFHHYKSKIHFIFNKKIKKKL